MTDGNFPAVGDLNPQSHVTRTDAKERRASMKNPWIAWLDATRFAAEAQHVIALRMLRLAGGGAAATTEAQRMVVEKMIASAQAQFAASMALVTGAGSRGAMGAAAKPYRRAVRANRRRLTRKR